MSQPARLAIVLRCGINCLDVQLSRASPNYVRQTELGRLNSARRPSPLDVVIGHDCATVALSLPRMPFQLGRLRLPVVVHLARWIRELVYA